MGAGTGVVVIGRNEGERFRACLSSLDGSEAQLVYVDSGSTDGSVAAARDAGAVVVELDMSLPFTAARARNAGFAAFGAAGMQPAFVQFLDGDCQLCPGWLEAARSALENSPELGVVTGWLSERYPEKSVYNAMCDHEWHGPVGEIDACGGLMMVRREAFSAVEGFNETVIAAEDDEFCIRLREAGWRIERIPREMALHDAGITRFSQWWKRMVRAGHAFAQVGEMHRGYFRRSRQRIWVYGAALPAAFVLSLLLGWKPVLVAVPLIYLVAWLRTARGLKRGGLSGRAARIHSAFLTMSKFAGLLGMLRYYTKRIRGGSMELIEYK